MIEWFDDLKLGMRFATGEKLVTHDDIVRFAREFDRQPFHVDEVAAEHTVLKGLAASGWHTAAITETACSSGQARFCPVLRRFVADCDTAFFGCSASMLRRRASMRFMTRLSGAAVGACFGSTPAGLQGTGRVNAVRLARDVS